MYNTLGFKHMDIIICLWGIFRTPVKTKETKDQKEIKSNRGKKKLIKQKRLSFIKSKQNLPKTRTLKRSSRDEGDNDQKDD